MTIDNKAFVGADLWMKQMVEEDSVDIMNNIMDELHEKVYDICPVATGHLRDSYRVKYAKSVTDKAYLENPVEYHDFVNDGTPHMAGRHMIEVAIASISKDASKYLKKR